MSLLNDLFKKNSSLYGPTSGYGISPVTTAPVPTRTQVLPNDSGSYQTPSGQSPSLSSIARGTPVQTPIIKSSPAKKPVSTSQSSVKSSPIPQQWINPKTGGFYTPDEIAANLAASAPGATRSVNGDIPKFAGDTLTEGPQTTEQLQTTAANLNNSRNDIAVGETDPYKVASESGIAYTPQELAAIEKAYAGIYDPAINSALSKLDTKQKQDSAALENKNKLEQMAKEHQYDLELKRTPSGDSINTSVGGTGNDSGYVKGKNPLVDDYVNRINTGQITEDDLITKYLPGVKNTGIRSAVLQGLNATRYENSKTAGDLDTINTIGQLLDNPQLSRISGPIDQFLGGFSGGKATTAKNQYNQLQGALELAASGKLKGQGQVSNYERDILKSAASALKRNLNDEEFRKQLVKFQGATRTASGLETPVRITDPKTHESQIIIANTAGISSAIKDGMAVEYVGDNDK